MTHTEALMLKTMGWLMATGMVWAFYNIATMKGY